MFDEESSTSSSNSNLCMNQNVKKADKSQAKSLKLLDTDNPNFKLHIDSNLIKSNSSALPDELKSLGVCSYNENDFERGVLYQVDLQIAEYELNKAKKKLDLNKIPPENIEKSQTIFKQVRINAKVKNYSPNRKITCKKKLV